MIKKENLKDIKKILVKSKLNIIIRYLDNLDRTKVIFFLFSCYALVIIITAFKYSVLENKYYSKLAEWQQTKVITNSVSRGTIYSNNNPVGVLSTSTDLSDLAIDPKQPWSREKLVPFLTDILFREFCFLKEEELCKNNIEIFIKIDTLENWIYDENFIKSKITEELNKRIDKKNVDFVLIKENLDEKDKIKVMSIWNDALIIKNDALYFDFNKKVTILNDTIDKLNEFFGIPKDFLQKLFTPKEVRYIKLVSKLNLQNKDKIDERIKNELSAINKWLLEEKDSINKFIILEPNPTRFYPEKNLASQILGFVDNWWNWRYWVEWYFNEELKWQEWVKITKKDISWKPIGPYEQLDKKLINGSDVKLTIDRNVQKAISKILEDGIKEFRANKWSVVVMDPKTWAIVAMASYPDFDPNNFWSVYELEKVNYSKYPNPGFDLLWLPVFVEDSSNFQDELKYEWKMIKLRLANEKELTNRAIPKYKFKNNLGPWTYINDTIGSLYEPGSVFKAITTSIWVDTWDIKPSDYYQDKWFVQIDNFKIKNVSKECIGYHTYSHALDWSCNVWMIDIVKKIWSSLFYKYINDFGFGNKTNITLEWEVFGKIEPYEKWSKAKLFTQSFGQWITATVLQMATAYSVIANWWVYMQPYIVDTRTLPNWQVIKNMPTPLRRVIKEETSKKIIAMLTEWATIWFAKKWWVEGYDMAWKTGTSQIASKWKYEQDGPWHTITSYGWFGPSSNPKFVMIVKIERPRTAEFSETTSSALFSKMSKYLLNYYAIPKSK